MKKIISLSLLSLIAVLSLASCKEAPTGLWETATYTEDTVIGEGDTTFTLTVTAEEKTVTFTVSTNEKTLGEALVKLGLVKGESGAYGLYITEVNGMELVYDTHGMYWSVTQNGTTAPTGADGISLENGGVYGFETAK